MNIVPISPVVPCLPKMKVPAAVLLAALLLAGCGGGGSDTSAARTGDEVAQAPKPTEGPAEAASNVVMSNDAPGVRLKGNFERVDGYLSWSPKVLSSVGSSSASAIFGFDVPRRGFYEVFAWWPQNAASNSAAQIVVEHEGGETPTAVDQSVSGGEWNSLGVFRFDPTKPVSVSMNQVGSSTLLVDAMRVQFVGEQAPELSFVSTELPIGTQGRAYSARVAIAGGMAPYSYRLVDAPLPEGLSLGGATGFISGTPVAAGNFAISVEVIDANGSRTIRKLILSVTETTVATGDPAAPTPGDPAPPAPAEPAPPKVIEPPPSTEPTPSTPEPDNPGPGQLPPPIGSGADLSALMTIVSSLPEGGWSKVNLNDFSSVWTPEELRPMFAGGNPNPDAIIKAWSSFAWDSNRGNLILYGGGHANYRGNDVYIWRGATRMWERASLPSESKQDSLGNWNAIDGAAHAPASAHTYDNSVFLPIVDRFLTLGGAADSNGGAYMTLNTDTKTSSRKTGPYLFDPSRADANKVGGTTGSHVKRVAPHPEIVGGNMWSNREAFLLNTLSMPSHHNFVEGCTAYSAENGKDVVYVRTYYNLYKYTLHDLRDPTKDTWENVAVFWGGPGNQVACGYDPVSQTFVRTATNEVPFVYWNLRRPGSLQDKLVIPIDPTGEFERVMSSKTIDIRNCGFDFDPPRRQFALWCGDGRVWMLKIPQEISETGWTIRQQPTFHGPAPNGDVGTGILGKWEYVQNLDVFIGLQDSVKGNIWLYKPVGWRKP